MKSIKWIYIFFVFVLSLKVNASENVYLHFDQSGYFLEETMWFKAYVMDMRNGKLTTKSEVLYVELLSPEGYIVESMKYKLKNGMCDGYIKLRRTMHSGFYEVRAYTRYMLNYGTDNYFTRVFPVYEEVRNGDYHIQRMLMRERKVKKHKESLDEKGYISHDDSTSSSILDYKVADTIMRPFQKITIEFKGNPGDVFSLSVADASSYLFTNYRSNISKYNTSTYENILTSIPYLIPPEKDIAIIGKVIKKKFKFGYGDVESLIPDTPLQFSMETPDNTYTSTFKTDSSGYFMLSLGDFYGDYLSNVRAMNYSLDDEDVSVCIDKWFSPPPRPYRDEEMLLFDERPRHQQDKGKESSFEDDKKLPELVVKQRKRRRGWRESEHSMLTLNVAEEIEWYKDHYPGMSLDLFSFIATVFQRYDYPVGHVRFLILDGDYEGDSIVPVSRKLYENASGPIPLSKRMIIRTDEQTCSTYNYSKFKPEYRSGNIDGNSVIMTLGPTSAPKEGKPDYVVCFEPFKPYEKSLKQHLIYNNVSNNRYTVIKGFTKSEKFTNQNYENHNPKSDFRRTLYWNPSVRVDSTGVAKVEFYNNSTCKELHISAEGIGADMHPIIYKSK